MEDQKKNDERNSSVMDMANEVWYSMSPEFPNHEISNLKRVKHKAHTTEIVYDYKEKIYGERENHAFKKNNKMHFRALYLIVNEHFNELQKQQETEIWKDINGFDGYQISNHGRIKRLAYTTIVENFFPDRIIRKSKYNNNVALFTHPPRKINQRNVERLYRKYVLKETVEFKQKKGRRKLKVIF